MRKTIAHLTHQDLDALGCMLVLGAKFPKEQIETFHTNYRNIDEVVHNTIDFCNKYNPDFLVISDVSFSEFPELLDKLCNLGTPVKYFDHHVYPAGFFDDRNLMYIHDITKSATKIMFDTLQPKVENLPALVELINVYDLWNIKSKHFRASMELNEYFWTKGVDWLVDEIVSRGYKLPKDYIQSTRDHLQNATNAINKARTKGLIQSNGVTTIAFMDSYFNDLLYIEFTQGVKHFILANSYGIIRVRFNHDVDIPEEWKIEAKKKILGNSNIGHLNAFAFKLEKNSFENIMKEIERISKILAS